MMKETTIIVTVTGKRSSSFKKVSIKFSIVHLIEKKEASKQNASFLIIRSLLFEFVTFFNIFNVLEEVNTEPFNSKFR